MINIYTGNFSDDLQAGLFDELRAGLNAMRESGNSDAKILLIVPAQFTLETEEAAFDALGEKGFFDFHVMSGAKLRSEILKETAMPGKTAVNAVGRNMILRKVAAAHKDELSAFASLGKDSSFLSLTGDFIVQMKQNGLKASDLRELREKHELGGILSRKLDDMQIFADAYEEVMEGKFTDSEDLLAFTTAQVKNSALVKNSEIYFYGFYSFTAGELEFLRALNEYSRGLKVFLSAGDGSSDICFRASERTVKKLQETDKDATLTRINKKRNLPEDLLELGSGLYRFPAPQGKSSPGNIVLWECSSPFSQAETVASEVFRLTREGLSLSDMAVLTPGDGSGSGALKRVFTDCGIPFFMDTKRSIIHSPAAEASAAMLRIAAGAALRSDVLSLLKTGFTDIQAEELELFENYVKLYHISGERFFKPFKYGADKYSPEEFEMLESVRANAAALIGPFIADMDNAKTAEEKTAVFYDALANRLQLEDKAAQRSALLAQLGFTDASEELPQVFATLVSLMEQIVELLGGEELSTKEYADLFCSSLEDIKVGLLPQSAGKLQIGTIGRTKTNGCKVLFICGLNDGSIPSSSASEGLLTERELESLEAKGYTFAKRSSVLAEEESFNIARAFSVPTEKLCLSYCTADENGDALQPSRLLRQIESIFPQLKAQPDIESAGQELPFLNGRAMSTARLSRSLRSYLSSESEDVDPIWKKSASLLSDAEREALAKALFYKTGDEKLDEEVARELFSRGGEYNISPSQLESFAQCPFKHFIRYGLKPEELREFSLDSRNTGDIFHEMLLRLSKRLNEDCEAGRLSPSDPESRWMTITDEELEALTDEILDEISESFLGGLVKAEKENEYTLSRMKKVARKFAKEMISQVRKGRIDSMFFETSIERSGDIKPLKINTALGPVSVRGRIDRVDILAPDGEEYIKIMDYKSGSQSFDKELTQKGLNLQLMIYLEAGLQKPGTKPAGIFYYRIKDAAENLEFSEAFADEISEKIKEKIEDQYRLNGLFIDNPELVSRLDSGYREGKKSGVFETKALISEEDFNAFRSEFNKSLIAICTKLRRGDVSVRPEKLQSRTTACDKCSYQKICLYRK